MLALRVSALPSLARVKLDLAYTITSTCQGPDAERILALGERSLSLFLLLSKKNLVLRFNT